MDIWNEKKRSAVMARIKSKDTKPEWIVRHYLYSKGYRYRKNVKGLPGSPDIVLRKYGVVIFVHGCFWHGHNIDGHIPLSNSDYWKNKIMRNQERDTLNKQKLLNMGWTVIVVWECQLKRSKREQTLNEVEYYINKAFLDHLRVRNSTSYLSSVNENHKELVAEDEIMYGRRIKNDYSSSNI